MAKLTGGEGWSLVPAGEPSGPGERPNPRSPKPHVRLERRMGKEVTVIAGLHTYGRDRLERMARELKRTYGCGGTVKDGVIEVQGDRVEATRAWLAEQLKR
ncbi:MAG: hypothetical protein MOGMAGMI_01439 [Candidatus Omnitrophica bacterium]|nr:hypothetical protein [Candidatus Omnitrophota bacterium]